MKKMQDIPKLSAALFDMDGTLIDTENIYHSCAKIVCAEYGYDFTPEDKQFFLGKTADILFSALKPKFNREITLEEFVAKNLSILGQHLTKDHIFKNVEATIQQLRAANIPVYVVTNAHKEAAKLCLDRTGLNHQIDGLICADDVQNSKPNPEPYLLAAKRSNSNIHHCLVVEDSPTGVQAAQSAGAYVVAVTTSTSSDQLKAADRIVQSFHEIPFAEMFSL